MADDLRANPFALAEQSVLADVMPHGYFAPVSKDTVDELLRSYHRVRTKLLRVSEQSKEALEDCFGFFVGGNMSDDRQGTWSATVERLFNFEGAVKNLNAHYWKKALALTDVYQHMPQARRTQWDTSVREMTTPDFEPDTVYSTLRELLLSREQFLAERVDGIFRNLSGAHVTNRPEGFSTKMILAHLVDGFDLVNHDKEGYITDLRCVIARFMGRDEPGWHSTTEMVKYGRQYHRGEWLTVDGGSMQLRCYKMGTAHIQVHPSIAWRLNSILAMLYPTAIPPEFRRQPTRKTRTFELIDQPLPCKVLAVLGTLTLAGEWYEYQFQKYRRDLPNTLDFPYGNSRDVDPVVKGQIFEILESIGGVRQPEGHFLFDYDPRRVLGQIVHSGAMPHAKSHQFYPTPEALAQRLVELAEIEPHHHCLEPSAGVGGLAKFMPKDQTACVEVSALHCKVLRSQGFSTAERDFPEWAAEQLANRVQFDRIVMNPPFSLGRAQLHVDTARSLLAPTGRLVAIVPSTFTHRPAPTGWHYEFSEILENQFSDASVRVVLLTATHAQ